MTPIDPLTAELAEIVEASWDHRAVGLPFAQEFGEYHSRKLEAVYARLAARIRAIILAEERAKPAAQRWAEMGDEEVAAMAKEMPAVASAWELIDEGDGLHGRRAYCVESSLLFASSRDEMRDVDSSNCGYRLIGGIPDAAPDAEVR